MNFNYIVHGLNSKRRAAIVKWFNENPDASICVNRKWCIQIKYDADLKFLVKTGFIKQVRRGSPRSRYTFLVKA